MPPGVWRLATDGSSRPAAPKPPRADSVWRLAVVANFFSRTVAGHFIGLCMKECDVNKWA